MDINISFGVLSAIVVGLVEVAKQLGLNPKFAPIASIIFSLGLLSITGVSFPQLLIGALIMGLSAVGMYSGVKNTIEGIKSR